MRTRLYSDTIGIPVVSETTGFPLMALRDILLDHETGKIAAFLLSKHRIILPIDVLTWDDYLLISDETSISKIDEVVRVMQVFKKHILIFGKKVVTEDGEYLGRVHDMAFDTDGFSLSQLYVAKFFLIFRFAPRIFPFSSIVEVRKEKIIVKNTIQKKEEVAVEPTFSPA